MCSWMKSWIVSLAVGWGVDKEKKSGKSKNNPHDVAQETCQLPFMEERGFESSEKFGKMGNNLWGKGAEMSCRLVDAFNLRADWFHKLKE